MRNQIQRIIEWCAGIVVSLLLAGNIFFIKRLVDKIDSQENNINSQVVIIQALKDKIDLLEYQISELQRQRERQCLQKK